MSDAPYTDPAQLPIGSRHVFVHAGIERTFTRVPGGWNGVGRFVDDADMSDDGWVYVRPAD